MRPLTDREARRLAGALIAWAVCMAGAEACLVIAAAF